MDTKKLYVPAKDFPHPITLRAKVRDHFEREYRGPEHIVLHFLNGKCQLEVRKPVAEFSPLGRLQFHIENHMIEYGIVPSSLPEVTEG